NRANHRCGNTAQLAVRYVLGPELPAGQWLAGGRCTDHNFPQLVGAALMYRLRFHEHSAGGKRPQEVRGVMHTDSRSVSFSHRVIGTKPSNGFNNRAINSAMHDAAELVMALIQVGIGTHKSVGQFSFHQVRETSEFLSRAAT